MLGRGFGSFATACLVAAAGAGPALAGEVVSSPDGRHVYVDSRAGGMIALSRAPVTGALSVVGRYPGGGAGSVDISSDGRSVYVAEKFPPMTPGATRPRVTAFARDPGSGALARVSVTEPPTHTTLDDLVVAPNGRQVYAADAITHALLTYDRDPDTGALTLRQSIPDQGGTALSVTGDGRFLYVAQGGGVAKFARADDGALTRGVTRDCEFCAAYSLVASPDESRLFAGPSNPGLLFRDGASGDLTPGN